MDKRNYSLQQIQQSLIEKIEDKSIKETSHISDIVISCQSSVKPVRKKPFKTQNP